MIAHKYIVIPQKGRGFHLITRQIVKALGKLPENGLVHLFLKHTSAAITINENADPSVRIDFETFINDLIPEKYQGFTHTMEGDDDMPAHIKSSLFGISLTIPIKDGKLDLGTWQGIYLCEFRNATDNRKISATIYY